MDTTTSSIREAEPVDLTVERTVLEAKHAKFSDLLKDLHRCEPRVTSLQEAADQLELQVYVHKKLFNFGPTQILLFNLLTAVFETSDLTYGSQFF